MRDEEHSTGHERVRAIPLLAWPILGRPDRVAAALQRVAEARLVEPVPNVWQICVGVMRMWHRMAFRPESIGLSASAPRRPGWRARLFERRTLRFPFLLWEGSVIPYDLSGLVTRPKTLARHVIGTHHDGDQALYDLEILATTPGALEALRAEVSAVVDADDRRSRWLRDLVVYEGYHERLLALIDDLLAGRVAGADDPDIGFGAYLRWCARQPATPAATWRAARNGTLRLA